MKSILRFLGVVVCLGMIQLGLSGCQAAKEWMRTRELNGRIEKACREYAAKPDWPGLKEYVELEQKAGPGSEGWAESTAEILRRNLALAKRKILQAAIRAHYDALMADKRPKEAQSYLSDVKLKKPDGWDSEVFKMIQGLLEQLLRAEIQQKYDGYCEAGKTDDALGYLTEVKKDRQDGWCESIEAMVLKMQSELWQTKIKKTHDDFYADCKFAEANDFLEEALKCNPKPDGWDAAAQALAQDLLEKLRASVAPRICALVWKNVKAALDKRDFETARRLTSMAEPDPQAVEESTRLEVLVYRIGVLNEIINPYQSDWIIYEMKAKVRELVAEGKSAEAKSYLASIQPIRDEFPSIYKKVDEIAPGLENLYWLQDRVDSYLEKNKSQIQGMMDARSVIGSYRDYKEVYALVDAAVAEMKVYNPYVGEDNVKAIDFWGMRLKSVRRVMTTAGLNESIMAAKEELLKTLE